MLWHTRGDSKWTSKSNFMLEFSQPRVSPIVIPTIIFSNGETDMFVVLFHIYFGDDGISAVELKSRVWWRSEVNMFLL